MKLKNCAHILTGLTLGVVLGAPPVSPLPGYVVALTVALILRKLKLLREGKEAVEYAGMLTLSWVLVASLLHWP